MINYYEEGQHVNCSKCGNMDFLMVDGPIEEQTAEAYALGYCQTKSGGSCLCKKCAAKSKDEFCTSDDAAILELRRLIACHESNIKRIQRAKE